MNGLLQTWKPLWLNGYSRPDLVADLIGGLVVAALLVPQAMAYALLAGLPPEIGLHAAVVAPVIYAFVGRSAVLSLGPVALASLLVADAVEGSGLAATEAAAIVAMETGLLLAALGLLGMGRLVNFLSEPALIGFTAAAAVLIALSQLPAFLGVDAPRSANILDAVQAIAAAGAPHWPTVALATATLAALVLADRYAAASLWRLGVRPPYRLALVKSVPLALIVLASVAAAWMGTPVALVHPPETGLPRIGVPLTEPAAWLALLVPSAIIAVIVFVTGMAVAKSLAGRQRTSVDTSREALAIGAANIGTGLLGGYVVGASLSRSALVFETGGKSPLASAFAGLVVLAIILALTPLLGYLPKAALAALVMSAVIGLIRPDDIRSVWDHNRAEAAVLFATAAITLGVGVRFGLLTGAIAGIAAFLWHSSKPRVSRLGSTRVPGIYRTIDRDEIEIDTLPVLLIRIDRSIYFGNAAYVEDRLQELLAKHDEIDAVLFDMRAINGVDASGIRMLDRLLERLEEQKIAVGFAVTHTPIEEALKSSRHCRKAPFFLTIEEGLDGLRPAGDKTE